MKLWKYCLILALSLPFSTDSMAHVVFNSTEIEPGRFHTAKMRVTHGCDGSPTIRVTVQIPEGVTRVTPRAVAGWKVKVAKRKLAKSVKLHGMEMTETVSAIIWYKGNLPDHAYEQFEFRMMAPSKSDETLVFLVNQQCRKGDIQWTEVPVEGQNPYELDHPAAFLKLK